MGNKSSRRNNGQRGSRKRSLKASNRVKFRRRKLKASRWKLAYPEVFKRIDTFPYVVRKDDPRYQ